MAVSLKENNWFFSMDQTTCPMVFKIFAPNNLEKKVAILTQIIRAEKMNYLGCKLVIF
jgi:hypothetical protein